MHIRLVRIGLLAKFIIIREYTSNILHTFFITNVSKKNVAR